MKRLSAPGLNDLNRLIPRSRIVWMSHKISLAWLELMLSAVVHFIADENVVKSESLLTHVQNPETVFTFFTQFYPILPDRTFSLDSLKRKQSKVHSFIWKYKDFIAKWLQTKAQMGTRKFLPTLKRKLSNKSR